MPRYMLDDGCNSRPIEAADDADAGAQGSAWSWQYRIVRVSREDGTSFLVASDEPHVAASAVSDFQ